MEPLPPAPPPPPAPPRGDSVRAPAAHEPVPELPPVEEGPPGEYAHFWSVFISPKVLMYVPAPALFLVFIMTFLPWVGIYPGGVYLHSQNAYFICFGLHSTDSDIGEKGGSLFEGEGGGGIGFFGGGREKPDKPGFSVLMLFFLLAFYPALLLAIAALALTFFGAQLPPQVRALLKWRWAVVAGIVLIALGFLGLQLLFGFNMEQSIRGWANKPLPQAELERRANLSGQERAAMEKGEAAGRGFMMQMVSRTLWPNVVVILLLLALVCSLLLFWIDFRGNTPLPRVDLIW
jgi:hypothetical protein